MKIKKTTVLEYLKPKVTALGFKKDILEDIAADIADSLEEVEENASEEEVNAKIKPAVEAVIPNLKLVQRLTNQGIEEYRKKHEKANEQNPVEKNPGEGQQEGQEQQPSGATPKEETNKTLEWLKEHFENQAKQMNAQTETIKALQTKIAGIEAKDVNTKRRAMLDDLLKDTGTFGKRTIKSFEKMTFSTDEEFDSFVSDLKEDLEQLNQERANEGLDKFGAPKVEVQSNQQPPKTNPMSDAELEELAATM